MNDLTENQRDELTSQYVELVVDSMDMKTLIQIVTDNLIDYHNVSNETVLDINNTGGKY